MEAEEEEEEEEGEEEKVTKTKGKKEFFCDVCSKKLSSWPMLVYHRSIVHSLATNAKEKDQFSEK